MRENGPARLRAGPVAEIVKDGADLARLKMTLERQETDQNKPGTGDELKRSHLQITLHQNPAPDGKGGACYKRGGSGEKHKNGCGLGVRGKQHRCELRLVSQFCDEDACEYDRRRFVGRASRLSEKLPCR